MKKLVNYLVTSIVNHPEAVKIAEQKNQEEVALQLSVHPDDLGQVIGKEGKIIKAIRRLCYVLAIKNKKRVNLELVEESKS